MDRDLNTKRVKVRKAKEEQSKKGRIILIGIVVLFVTSLLLIKYLPNLGDDASYLSSEGDLLIIKSEVTEKAKFYPYTIDGVNMEVLAVKAKDGSVRTAFNTCQVCFDSGRGYYIQEGDEVVCQNCGNRFKIEQIEIIKGGCNPVPIMTENKTDDGTNITVPREFLVENNYLFLNNRN